MASQGLQGPASGGDEGGCIVFVGPCLAGLTAGQRRHLLHGMDVRPPVARGDVLSALCERPHTLVILDGYYYTRPSIPHKELLYAIESGVRVLGGASMGALRAAELASCGMEGFGEIFNAYREGRIDGDDEVALMHTPEDDDYRALTIASIEVRHVLGRLEGRGLITREQGQATIQAVRRVSFGQRTPEFVLEQAQLHLGEAAPRLMRMLRRSSSKRRDAILTLTHARRRTNPPPPPASQHRRANTLYFDYFRLWGLSVPLRRSLAESTLHRAAYLALAFHPAAATWVQRWRLEFLLAWVAGREGWEPSAPQLAAAVDELQDRHAPARGILPALEFEQQARQRLRAELALSHLGDLPTAIQHLNAAGLPDPTVDRPASQDLHRIMPPWALVRSFALTPLLTPALELAQRVFPLVRRFAQWSGGAKVGRDPIRQDTARRWQCSQDVLESEGLRRGLLLGDGFAEGLWEILEALVVAERLRPPVEGYTACREALLACDPLTTEG